MSAANAPKSPATTTSNLPSWLDEAPAGSLVPGGSWTTVEPPRPVYPNHDFYGAGYRPTAEQLARDDLRRHYLRRNVYTPLIIAALIVAALFVVVLVLAFVVDTPAARSFIAGMAGLVVILFAIPLIIVMSILPLVWLGVTLNRRQQRRLYPQTGPMAYRSVVQRLLWQVEGYLDTAGASIARGGRAITQPLIGLHARADYWRAFFGALYRPFGRFIERFRRHDA